MVKILLNQEIAFAYTDVIVNAANGCGYMCGSVIKKAKSRDDVPKGVSESLNYYTNGKLERIAMIKARRFDSISSWLFGTKSGEYFVTQNCGLNCKEIFHAVTMRYPGSKSNLKSIKVLIKQIFEYCDENGYKSIAMPYLGCGTGGLDKSDVYSIIENYSQKYPRISVDLYG